MGGQTLVAQEKKKHDDAAKAETAPVNFGEVPLSTLVPGKCSQFFNGNAYQTAKSNFNTANTKKTQADATQKAAKKAYDDAVAAAKKAKTKCECETLKAAQTAYDTATAY